MQPGPTGRKDLDSKRGDEMIPVIAPPNPANWKTLGDYWQPPTPQEQANLQGSQMRNRLAAIQMQDEMDYRNALLKGSQPLSTQAPPVQTTTMVPQSPRVPQGIDPMENYIPAEQPPDVPVTTTAPVNALAGQPEQPMTIGAIRARQDLVTQEAARVKAKFDQIKMVSGINPEMGAEMWNKDPELGGKYGPMTKNGQTGEIKIGDKTIGYSVKMPDGKWRFVDAKTDAAEKFDKGNLYARAIRGDTEAQAILKRMQEDEKSIAESKREGPDRLAQGRAASDLRKQFYGNPVVKDFNDISGKFKLMEKALEESRTSKNNVAIDQALITLFNKMTDPSSVVRESEYARTSGDLALVNKIKGKAEKIMKGGAGLTLEERQALTNMGRNFHDIYRSRYLEKEDEFRGYANLQGVNPDLVIRPLSKSKEGPTPDSPAQRNNNYLNLKVGKGTQSFIDQGIASVGSAAKDGGNFLKFNSPEEGIQKAKEFLFSSPAYTGLTVHNAMKKWSNGGYAGNIAPQIADKKLTALTEPERDMLIQKMLKAEGSGSISTKNMTVDAGNVATDAGKKTGKKVGRFTVEVD